MFNLKTKSISIEVINTLASVIWNVPCTNTICPNREQWCIKDSFIPSYISVLSRLKDREGCNSIEEVINFMKTKGEFYKPYLFLIEKLHSLGYTLN